MGNKENESKHTFLHNMRVSSIENARKRENGLALRMKKKIIQGMFTEYIKMCVWSKKNKNKEEKEEENWKSTFAVKRERIFMSYSLACI